MTAIDTLSPAEQAQPTNTVAPPEAAALPDAGPAELLEDDPGVLQTAAQQVGGTLVAADIQGVRNSVEEVAELAFDPSQQRAAVDQIKQDLSNYTNLDNTNYTTRLVKAAAEPGNEGLKASVLEAYSELSEDDKTRFSAALQQRYDGTGTRGGVTAEDLAAIADGQITFAGRPPANQDAAIDMITRSGSAPMLQSTADTMLANYDTGMAGDSDNRFFDGDALLRQTTALALEAQEGGNRAPAAALFDKAWGSTTFRDDLAASGLQSTESQDKLFRLIELTDLVDNTGTDTPDKVENVFQSVLTQSDNGRRLDEESFGVANLHSYVRRNMDRIVEEAAFRQVGSGDANAVESERDDNKLLSQITSSMIVGKLETDTGKQAASTTYGAFLEATDARLAAANDETLPREAREKAARELGTLSASFSDGIATVVADEALPFGVDNKLAEVITSRIEKYISIPLIGGLAEDVAQQFVKEAIKGAKDAVLDSVRVGLFQPDRFDALIADSVSAQVELFLPTDNGIRTAFENGLEVPLRDTI